MSLAEIVDALKVDSCQSWCNGYVVVRNEDGSIARIDCDCNARNALVSDNLLPY